MKFFAIRVRHTFLLALALALLILSIFIWVRYSAYSAYKSKSEFRMDQIFVSLYITELFKSQAACFIKYNRYCELEDLVISFDEEVYTFQFWEGLHSNWRVRSIIEDSSYEIRFICQSLNGQSFLLTQDGIVRYSNIKNKLADENSQIIRKLTVK